MRGPYRRQGSLGANAQQGSSLQVKKMKSFGFCRIVHTSLMLEQGLMLPMKFVRKFGDELHDVAVLKVPDGKRWDVELRQSGCRIVFHNGWQEFVEHYSIATGHFLVFRYNENSDFRVSIFDTTACEICYSRYIDYLEEPNSGKETEEARPGMLGFSINKDGDNSLEELADKPSGGRHSYTRATVARRLTGEAQVKNRATGLQSALEPKHPSFRVVMRSSYVNGSGRYLPVPLRFFSRYLKNGSRSLTLKSPDGHRWVVGWISFNCTIIHICKGWPKFVKGNNLEEGDICEFELIEDALLKVHIVSKCEDVSPTTKNMKVLPIHERHLRAEAFVPPKGKDIAMEASRTLKLKHPSFEVAMKSQYVKHGFLPLPKHFTRKYLRGMFNYVTLKLADEREWEIKCIFGEGRCRFSQGWSEVMRETNMKEGDLCVFELIKKNAGVFRVYVCHELED